MCCGQDLTTNVEPNVTDDDNKATDSELEDTEVTEERFLKEQTKLLREIIQDKDIIIEDKNTIIEILNEKIMWLEEKVKESHSGGAVDFGRSMHGKTGVTPGKLNKVPQNQASNGSGISTEHTDGAFTSPQLVTEDTQLSYSKQAAKPKRIQGNNKIKTVAINESTNSSKTSDQKAKNREKTKTRAIHQLQDKLPTS